MTGAYIIRWMSTLRRAAYTDTHPFVLDIMTIIPRIDSVSSNAPQSRCNYTSLTTTPATQISGNSYIVTLGFLDSILKRYQSHYLSSKSWLPVRKKEPGGHVIGDDALRFDEMGRRVQGRRGHRHGHWQESADIHAYSRRNRERAHSIELLTSVWGRFWFLDRAHASTCAPRTLTRKQYCMLFLSAPRVKRSEILHE